MSIVTQKHRLLAVALFTRAWIEIMTLKAHSIRWVVALFTRAWIEIPLGIPEHKGKRSPSSRGRGLKSIIRKYCPLSTKVALFTRAWIEIADKLGLLFIVWSPSSRGRGLKYGRVDDAGRLGWSPSSRGRGLKSDNSAVGKR